MIGGDLGTLDSELEKLALYKNGGSVRDEDVEVLVSYTREATIFATVDAMIEGRVGASIRLVQQLLDSGRPGTYLLTMMARQTRLLLLAKDLKERGVPVSDIGKRLRLSGYPLKKTLEQERMFTSSHLSDIHNMVLETDISMKSSSIDEITALELLVAEIASKAGDANTMSYLKRS
jgi:DNA polymerase-3 subunit delta